MSLRPCDKTDDDAALLRAIAGGDRRALEALYLGYHRRLSRFLSGVASRHENAEEIINDTFMVVWRHAQEFRGASRVSTWIIGIAYRIALKSLRGHDAMNRAQRTMPVPEQSVQPMEQTELDDWIGQALDQLPLEQRLTVELAYKMGHSVEEIAVITGCPAGTVKARMFHARQKLRAHLPALAGVGAGDTFHRSRMT